MAILILPKSTKPRDFICFRQRKRHRSSCLTTRPTLWPWSWVARAVQYQRYRDGNSYSSQKYQASMIRYSRQNTRHSSFYGQRRLQSDLNNDQDVNSDLTPSYLRDISLQEDYNYPRSGMPDVVHRLYLHRNLPMPNFQRRFQGGWDPIYALNSCKRRIGLGSGGLDRAQGWVEGYYLSCDLFYALERNHVGEQLFQNRHDLVEASLLAWTSAARETSRVIRCT